MKHAGMPTFDEPRGAVPGGAIAAATKRLVREAEEVERL